MHRASEQLIGQILQPRPLAPAEPQPPLSPRTAFTMMHVVQPQYCAGGTRARPYMGPERRAQGMLIAEVIGEDAEVGTLGRFEGDL